MEPKTWRPTEVDDDIFMLHDDGHAPSKIDAGLELPAGTSHDSMVNRWKLDKQGVRKMEYPRKRSRR